MLKLCMIMSASRDEDMVIDEEVFLRATELLHRTEKEMHKVYAKYGEADISRALEHIAAFIALRGAVRVAEVMRRFHPIIGTRSNLMEILDTLKMMEIIRMRIMEDGKEYVEYIKQEDL